VALAPPQARRCWVWRFASTSQARGGAQRRVRHKSTQKLSDKGARLAPYRSSTCPRCSDRSPPTYAKMLSSTLPTLWLMSWSRCRPSSEMSASMLPTLLGDAVATAADLTRRCRRQCCRPSSEMPSSRLPTLLEDVVVHTADPPRRCRRHGCRPYSKMSSDDCRPYSKMSSDDCRPYSKMSSDDCRPYSRCRRHGCRPYSKMSSRRRDPSKVPSYRRSTLPADAVVAVADHLGVPSEARPQGGAKKAGSPFT